MDQEVRSVSDAEWARFVLRGLISYHERIFLGGAAYADGSPICEFQEKCNIARHDAYLEALKFALQAVEDRMQADTAQ